MTRPNYITAIILTYNEEQNIRKCVECLTWVDRIVVVDSGSEDATVSIAQSLGASVYVNKPWPGFAAQRNWALDNVGVSHGWVLFVDADEIIPPPLGAEIIRELESPRCNAYYLSFKVILLGQWVKRSSQFPVWHPRLLRVGCARFKNSLTGHGETWDVQGPVGFLKEPYEHYCFSKGLSEWFEKHNRLSSMEAEASLKLRKELSLGRIVVGLAKGTRPARRQAARALAYRIPGWPFCRFFYSLVVRGGFLDGKAGLLYCTLYLIYELMIAAKALELKFKEG